MKRIVSLVLVFVLLLSSIPAVGAASGHNTETRHVVCTSLSSQARSYYTGSYTYDNIAALTPGNTSCLSTVNSAMFKSLHTLMSSTQTKSVSYKSLTEYWKDTDSTTSASKPILFYSDVLSNSYNREHVWPKSRASFYQSNGGSDLHHLRPTDTDVNSTRGNHTMGNVKASGTTYDTKENGGHTVLWYNAKYSQNGCDGLVEVNDNIKGDVARILLYVYVRWEERNLFENDPNPKQASGDTGGNNGKKVIESLDTLLQWCHDDPVDTWEMKRNDLVQDVQGNRNAFIDYPEFAWLLFGQTLPNDMTTPSGKAKSNGSTPTYRFTAASNNTNFGTVTTSGNTVTATPKSGYVVSGYSVSPTGAATVAQNGNVFTVSNVTANCTVTINFAAETPVPPPRPARMRTPKRPRSPRPARRTAAAALSARTAARSSPARGFPRRSTAIPSRPLRRPVRRAAARKRSAPSAAMLCKTSSPPRDTPTRTANAPSAARLTRRIRHWTARLYSKMWGKMTGIKQRSIMPSTMNSLTARHRARLNPRAK